MQGIFASHGALAQQEEAAAQPQKSDRQPDGQPVAHKTPPRASEQLVCAQVDPPSSKNTGVDQERVQVTLLEEGCVLHEHENARAPGAFRFDVHVHPILEQREYPFFEPVWPVSFY